MSWERIFAIVFSGFMVKLYAAAMALYIGTEAVSFTHEAFGSMAQGFGPK